METKFEQELKNQEDLKYQRFLIWQKKDLMNHTF